MFNICSQIIFLKNKTECYDNFAYKKGARPMKKYELEISYPHQEEDEAEQLGSLSAEEILSTFKSINWQQLRILQLQMQAAITAFTVTDSDTEQSIQITLNELAPSGQLEFRLESDIEVEAQHKILGLFSLKNKDYVSFRNLTMSQVQQYLMTFLNEDLDSLKNQYQSGHSVSPISAASKA